MLMGSALLCLIVSITDGDTLSARCPSGDAAHPYQQVRVRLAEIDAPESGQPYGRRSKEHLSALCFNVEATIRPTTTDRWGRTVARVECRGKDANLEQVRAGMAWAFTKYQTDADRGPNWTRVPHAWAYGPTPSSSSPPERSGIPFDHSWPRPMRRAASPGRRAGAIG